MKLVLLGTTGYHPNNRRHTACLMIPEAGIILDAGTAMFRARDLLVTSTIDIFITHGHLDHVIGLTYLFDVVLDKQVDRVTVHGADAALHAVQNHLFAEAVFPAKPPCDFRPLVGEVCVNGGGRLNYFPLVHPGGSVGFRLDWPHRSMAYVTDTTASTDADYLKHIRGVDLLVHECYFPDSMAELAHKTGHSYTTPVLEVARSAGVRRLVLVHINPLALDEDPLGLNATRHLFPKAEIGHDGMVIDF